MTELELLTSINESLNHIELGIGIITFAAIVWIARFFIKR